MRHQTEDQAVGPPQVVANYQLVQQHFQFTGQQVLVVENHETHLPEDPYQVVLVHMRPVPVMFLVLEVNDVHEEEHSSVLAPHVVSGQFVADVEFVRKNKRGQLWVRKDLAHEWTQGQRFPG